MAPGDPLFDFALALGVGVGGIYIAERRFACVSRLRQGSDESREHDTSSKQAGPPLVKCEGLACGLRPLAGKAASARGSESRLQACEHEPSGWQEHEQIREQRAVLALRAIRLGGHVPIRVVERQEIRLGRLVERVDDELKREQHEEDRRYLEEQREVDELAIAYPSPRQGGRQAKPAEGAQREVRGVGLAEERRGNEGRLHPFTGHHEYDDQEHLDPFAQRDKEHLAHQWLSRRSGSVFRFASAADGTRGCYARSRARGWAPIAPRCAPCVVRWSMRCQSGCVCSRWVP